MRKIRINPDYLSAFHELLWMWGASISPLLIGAFIHFIAEKGPFWHAIGDGVTGGEVYLYTATMLAPLFWVTIKTLKEAKESQRGLKDFSIGIYSIAMGFNILTLFASIILFSVVRLMDINETTRTLYFGIGVYIVSLVLWYYSILLNNKTAISHADSLKDDADSMINFLSANKG